MSPVSLWMGGRAWTRAGGQAAEAGLAGGPSVFRARLRLQWAGGGRTEGVWAPGLLLDLGPGTEAGRAGSPQPAA